MNCTNQVIHNAGSFHVLPLQRNRQLIIKNSLHCQIINMFGACFLVVLNIVSIIDTIISSFDDYYCNIRRNFWEYYNHFHYFPYTLIIIIDTIAFFTTVTPRCYFHYSELHDTNKIDILIINRNFSIYEIMTHFNLGLRNRIVRKYIHKYKINEQKQIK